MPLIHRELQSGTRFPAWRVVSGLQSRMIRPHTTLERNRLANNRRIFLGSLGIVLSYSGSVPLVPKTATDTDSLWTSVPTYFILSQPFAPPPCLVVSFHNLIHVLQGRRARHMVYFLAICFSIRLSGTNQIIATIQYAAAAA